MVRRSGTRFGGGVLTMDSERMGDCDIDLMARKTKATLRSRGGDLMGECSFTTYRRKKNRPALCLDDIYWVMDTLSSEAEEIAAAFSCMQDDALERYFNSSCILVAERIEIASQYRETVSWRDLYFATMEEALRPIQSTPQEYFFKAFPLEYENNVSDQNAAEFKKAERGLQLLYQIHLSAERIHTLFDGCYMRAPVPSHLLR